MLNQILESIGLNKKETEIYLCLLKFSAQPVSTIAKKTKINRTTCYGILEDLSKKGLVFHYIKKKIHYYEASSPESIKTYLEKEQIKIKQKLNLFKKNLDLLNNICLDTIIKPKIFFLEGLEGIKQTYEDTLQSKDGIILGIESMNKIAPEVKNYIQKEYIPKRVKLKTIAKSILPNSKEDKKFQEQDKKHLRETKIIKDPNFEFNFELNIYNDKVAFIVFQENHYSSFIIQNQIIAEGLKSVHQQLWNNN